MRDELIKNCLATLEQRIIKLIDVELAELEVDIERFRSLDEEHAEKMRVLEKLIEQVSRLLPAT